MMYKGLRAIGKRMGWSKDYVLSMHKNAGFRLYLLPRKVGYATKMVYCTDDESIALWLDTVGDITRQETLRRAHHKAQKRTQGASPRNQPRASATPSEADATRGTTTESCIDRVYGPATTPRKDHD